MKKIRVLSIIVVFSLCFSFISTKTGVNDVIASKAYAMENNSITLEQAQDVLSSSQYFTENKGQWHPSIKYMGNTPFGRIAFTSNGVCYEMNQQNDIEKTETNVSTDLNQPTELNQSAISSKYISLSFVNPVTPTLAGTKQLIHKNNYLFGPQESWAIGCNNYQIITYTNIWNGIDLSYTSLNQVP